MPSEFSPPEIRCLKHPPKQGEQIRKKYIVSRTYENSYVTFGPFMPTDPDVCCVSKCGIVSQPEAGENEQPDPTRQLREPTGIPNDDRTKQKSPIGEDRVERLALTGRE